MGTQTCPRRMNEMGPWKREENLDDWTTGRGLAGVQGDNLSCSFCGSLHPDTFMEWVEAGGEINPTDKTYKAYIECPLPNERYGESKTEILPSGTKLVSVYGREAKFYFQHLSTEQKMKFVDLYNARAMKIAGGGFYVSPFFMAPA